MRSLFVYGTLAPGRPNEHVLGDVEGTWEPGTVLGTLFEEGWGAESGYPGLIVDDNGSPVEGFVFTSHRLPDLWLRLDDFEGDGYERIAITATLSDGSQVPCQIYGLRRARSSTEPV